MHYPEQLTRQEMLKAANYRTWNHARDSMVLVLALQLLLTTVLCAAAGQPEESDLVTVVPPPDFLDRKPRIPDVLLSDKREGSYFTGLPLVGYDDELGFMYGAMAEWFDNGPRESSFFAYTPYRRTIYAGVSASASGSLEAFVGFDLPYINDSRWSTSGFLTYEKNDLENYFGAGEGSLEDLSFPGSDQTFKKFDDYERARDQVINGETWTRYDAYRNDQFALIGNLEYSFMGGRLRPLVGFQASKIRVGDYTGDTIDGAIQQETRLLEETREGNILGFAGGWYNLIRIGLTYDTRDFEPDPNSGVLARLLVQGSSELWGSESDFGQITAALSYFRDLLPERTRLVFAGNLVYASRFGDVPFYALPSLAVPNDELRNGLGGFNTVQGFLNNRFIGDATAYGNLELRWSFNEFTVWQQHIRLMLAPFAGGGRVFDNLGNTTLNDWKYGGGLGLRLAWNLSTVVSFNYAVSGEGDVFYMELGHPF